MSVFNLLSKRNVSLSTPDGLIKEIIDYSVDKYYGYIVKEPPFKFYLSEFDRKRLNLFGSRTLQDCIVIFPLPQCNYIWQSYVCDCLSHCLSILPNTVTYYNTENLSQIAREYIEKNEQTLAKDLLFKSQLVYTALFGFHIVIK